MTECTKAKTRKRFSAARVAAVSLLAVFAFVVAFADLIAPYDYAQQSRQNVNAPASTLRWRDDEGNFSLRPFIRRQRLADPLMQRYEEDASGGKFPVQFLVDGDPHSLFGFLPVRTRLFGVSGGPEAPRINLLGTDALGRDRFSRLLIAVRFSLLVCPIGAALACVIGLFVGLISGYSNRLVDTFLMGTADTMLALPALILILAARAAFPLELPPLRAAWLLGLIFAVTGWAGIARLARGLVRSLREREFVLAARSLGLSEARVLFRHILPNAAPPIVTQALVMLPYFLISEVALSFLGVGLQEPEPSLGNMLAAANDVTQLTRQPFLLLAPAIVIVVFVMAVRSLPGRYASEVLPVRKGS